MANYTANQLSGEGSPCESLTGGTTYTLTLSNPLSGSAYFTFETKRDNDGFYNGSNESAGGVINNLSLVSSLISSPYIFSFVINSGGGSFDFTPTVTMAASGSFLRTTGETTLQITGGGVSLNDANFNSAITLWFTNQASAEATYGLIGDWNTTAVTNMGNAFTNRSTFNENINSWDVSNVIVMSQMFAFATSFNQDLTGWNVSKVDTMASMFNNATAFNGDITTWVTTSVIDMNAMFEDADTFNQDISTWDTSNVTRFDKMFKGATSFNQNISSWDTSNVTRFDKMFKGATAYNNGGVPLNSWNVSGGTRMDNMFGGATAFNQEIKDWDTRNVTRFDKMFMNASLYNQFMDTVTTEITPGVFEANKWSVDQATDMSDMFSGALAFDQNIGRWLTNGNQPSGRALWTTAARMFGTPGAADAVTLSVANYNVLLIAWKNGPSPQNVSFSGGDSKYDDNLAISARQSFIDNEGWTIVDGGQV